MNRHIISPIKERVVKHTDVNGKKTLRYTYNTPNRYLFRDLQLLMAGDPLQPFDEMAQKNDLLLIGDEDTGWRSYRMALFIDNTWGWSPMPDETTAQLKMALLIQQ